MKKKNVKGFSLVELLAVMAILGILSGLGIIAYNRYSSRARNDSYTQLAESAVNGAQQYFMDHPRSSTVTLDDLLKGQYVNNINDPSDYQCSGKVEKNSSSSSTSSLQSTELTAYICCSRSSHNYQYDTETKQTTELIDTSKCNK